MVTITDWTTHNNLKHLRSHPAVFLEKSVLKICSKFTGEHPCWSVISVTLLCDFIEITLRHECSPINLVLIFRIPFHKNTSQEMLLNKSSNKIPKIIITTIIATIKLTLLKNKPIKITKSSFEFFVETVWW